MHVGLGRASHPHAFLRLSCQSDMLDTARVILFSLVSAALWGLARVRAQTTVKRLIPFTVARGGQAIRARPASRLEHVYKSCVVTGLA